MTEISKKALAIAKTQIGKEEHPRGSNSGPEVNQYLKAVGLAPGYAWCMAFVYWAFHETGLPVPLAKTAVVLDQYHKRFTNIVVNHLPQPGDIFIMEFKGGRGHTGFVETVDEGGARFTTIEGNSNDTGSREGYEVCRNHRKPNEIKAFLRF